MVAAVIALLGDVALGYGVAVLLRWSARGLIAGSLARILLSAVGALAVRRIGSR
ncbi:MAG: hypothetical protein WAL15_15790 [Xanthobacteraceae bacterium]